MKRAAPSGPNEAPAAASAIVAATAASLPSEAHTLQRARAFAEPLIAVEQLDTGENTWQHAEAVAQMNRYSDRQIVIADPALSRIRLGGRFTTTNPNDLLTALHASFGIRSQRSENGAITLTAG